MRVSARGNEERPGSEYGPCTNYWYGTVRRGSFGAIGPGDSGSAAIGHEGVTHSTRCVT